MELSSGSGHASTTVRWAQDTSSAFDDPPHVIPLPRQELSAMRVSGSDAPAESSASIVSPGLDAPRTMTLWRAIDHEVSALIGRRGTAAVLRRAVVIARRTQGWLPELPDDADVDTCARVLDDAFAGQAGELSLAGTRALEASVRDLLASLVGVPLTTQLLRTAWALRQACDEPRP